MVKFNLFVYKLMDKILNIIVDFSLKALEGILLLLLGLCYTYVCKGILLVRLLYIYIYIYMYVCMYVGEGFVMLCRFCNYHSVFQC